MINRALCRRSNIVLRVYTVLLIGFSFYFHRHFRPKTFDIRLLFAGARKVTGKNKPNQHADRLTKRAAATAFGSPEINDSVRHSPTQLKRIPLNILCQIRQQLYAECVEQVLELVFVRRRSFDKQTETLLRAKNKNRFCDENGRGQHEQLAERQGLQMAAVGGVPRVPTQQVLQTGHGLQVCPSGRQRGSPERPRHSLLRQHKGNSFFGSAYSGSWSVRSRI